MHQWLRCIGDPSPLIFDRLRGKKNMDQIAWLDPQFRQHNLQVLKITNEKSNTFPFGLMFCFQAPFEFWKSERLDETDNHSWRQVEPVNRKACMKCLNSGSYMKWRSIPWKIPLQNFKISHWWFLWSNLSHPSFNGLVKAPLNPPWGTLGLSSKKVEHELLGSVSPPLFSAFFHPGWTSDLRGGRFNKTVPLWAELGTICDQKQASLAKFFPDSPHGLQRNIADFIHSTSIFIDFHWWSAYPNLGCCVSVINKTHRSHRVVHFGTLKIGANDSQFFRLTGNSLALSESHQSSSDDRNMSCTDLSPPGKQNLQQHKLRLYHQQNPSGRLWGHWFKPETLVSPCLHMEILDIARIPEVLKWWGIPWYSIYIYNPPIGATYGSCICFHCTNKAICGCKKKGLFPVWWLNLLRNLATKCDQSHLFCLGNSAKLGVKALSKLRRWRRKWQGFFVFFGFSHDGTILLKEAYL